MKPVYLVIDTDAADRLRLATGLRQFAPGSTVIEAETGVDGIRSLEERGVSPSLVFTSYHLGDMNAIELLGRLRQAAWLRQPPALIVDDSISDRAVVDCYRLGAAGLIRKPILAYELREALRDFSRPAFSRTGPNLRMGHRAA